MGFSVGKYLLLATVTVERCVSVASHKLKALIQWLVKKKKRSSDCAYTVI